MIALAVLRIANDKLVSENERNEIRMKKNKKLQLLRARMTTIGCAAVVEEKTSGENHLRLFK